VAIHVREARDSDDAEAGELRVRAYAKRYAEKMPGVFVPAWRWDDLRDIAGSRRISTVLVAEENARLVGTLSLYRPGAEDNESWLPNAADLRYLAVLPEAMGRGVGGALVEAAEALAREWRCTHVCLHVREEALAGLGPFYEARGYLRDTAGDFTIPDSPVHLLAFRKPL